MVAGECARIARTVAAEMRCPAIFEIVAIHRGDHHMLQPKLLPPRGRHFPARRASSGPGIPVRTLQKAQARVQVSPMIIMVACACSQHSPIFGTTGLFAHGVKTMFAHDLARAEESLGRPAP